MNRAEKQTEIQALTEDFRNHAVVFALDFRGLRVDQATELRRKVRESGAHYRVVKNTLALRALSGTSLEPIASHFKGMTGVAYTASDPVALAKVLNDFVQEVPALGFKGGVVSGRAVNADQLKALANLPGRAELLAKLLYVLQAPVQNLLGVLQAPARDLILVLKAAMEKRKQE